MWSDLVLALLGTALYIGPFAVLPFIIRREPVSRRVAILALLVAPLIGATIYLLSNQKFSVQGLVLAYPFAMFPLGFWAALIGALTTPLMFRIRDKYGQVILMVAATLSGAFIGPVFMFGFVHLGAWIQQSKRTSVDLAFFLICGLTAGIVIGLLAAWVVGRTPRRATGVT
ncbi:MAG: hypothetical protein ACM3TN_25670 [Alphaproteobacteria bacterium]